MIWHFLLWCCVVASAIGDEGERRLFKKLKNDYDMKVRPVVDPGTALNVTIGVELQQILKLVRTKI